MSDEVLNIKKKTANPKTVEMVLDWLEAAAEAKMAAKSTDVIDSWASVGHLKRATVVLGVFQVSFDRIV